MPRTDERLLLEIQRLREEIAQLRQMVNTLFSIVFEDMAEEGPEEFPSRDDDLSMYN
ncbi:MAG: hypothetical protein ACE5HJ_06400 [Thermoplasmata archaeon]